MNTVKSLFLASVLLLGMQAIVGCDSSETEWTIDNWTNNGWGNNSDEEASAPFSEDLTVDQQTVLRLEGINGSVSVTGSKDAETVSLSGRRRVFADTRAEAQQHLDDVTVHIEKLVDQILISTDQPKNSDGRTYVVDYTVTVPEAFDVEIDAINGNLHLENLRGEVSASLANGKIECRSSHSPTKSVALSTINGDIELGIPRNSSARLTAKLVHGKITTSNLTFSNETRRSQSVTGTLGGGLVLIDLSTVNGDISVNGL